ncbi:MAG: hypothetical protein M3Q82_08915 [Actinomycetota bacterium]|nr:hypothetical protein [Actinomycetota bacterium]
MPTYHYACSSCSDEFDQYQSFTEDTLTVCPSCDGFIRRVIQPVGIVFKGTGWYLTDSRKPDNSESPADEGKKPAGDVSTDKADPKAAKSDASTTDAPKQETGAKKAEPAPAKKSVESKPASTPAA